jgi:DNA-binding GntR family transcriptional regulator
METGKIYDALKEKIIWLDLMPESLLNVSELAKSFNVSRTPVKEALIYLEAEGWVLRNGTHILVTPLSIERIKEISEIRSIMEVQANIWAMYRMDKEEWLTLKKIRKEIENLSEVPNNKQLVELDLKFHQTLLKASKNNQLAQILERLLHHFLRFWLSIPLKTGVQTVFRDTIEIIQAIQMKDEAGLKLATLEHIKGSVDEIMGTF